MKDLDKWLADAVTVLGQTRESGFGPIVEAAAQQTAQNLAAGRPLLVCGNGGSAADAMHIVGEMVGRFQRERKAINAICLSSNPSVLTAWSNDYSFDTVFSRQVEAYGQNGGVLFGLSTSGNSKNVVMAMQVARQLGMTTIGLTGEGGGQMSDLCDHLVAVPSKSTPAIQQVHLCLYHWYCARVEELLA